MKNIRKIIYAGLALATLTGPAFATQKDPMYYRRTLWAPAGERQLVLEAPLGMCFLDPSYYAEFRLSAAVQEALDDIDAGQLLGIFTPCMDAAGFSQGASGKVPVFGLITWLNPQVGETTDLALGAYLDMQEKAFPGMLRDNLASAAEEVKAPLSPAPAAAEDPAAVAQEDLGPEVAGLAEALAEVEGKAEGKPEEKTEEQPKGGRFSIENLPRVPEPNEPQKTYTAPPPDAAKSKYNIVNMPRVPDPSEPMKHYTPPPPDPTKSKYSIENMPRVPEPMAGPTGSTIEMDKLGFAYGALMLPLPAEYKLESKPHRTGAGVSVAYSAEMERDRAFYHTRGVAATTVLKTAPVMVMMAWTRDKPPSETYVRDLMDMFLAQQVALNSK